MRYSAGRVVGELMNAATPVIGAHYFVDLAGGAIAALTAIAVAVRLFPRGPEAVVITA